MTTRGAPAPTSPEQLLHAYYARQQQNTQAAAPVDDEDDGGFAIAVGGAPPVQDQASTVPQMLAQMRK